MISLKKIDLGKQNLESINKKLILNLPPLNESGDRSSESGVYFWFETFLFFFCFLGLVLVFFFAPALRGGWFLDLLILNHKL